MALDKAKILTAASAAAILGASAFITAPPATASTTYTVDVGCTFFAGSGFVVTLSSTSVSAGVGDVVRLNSTSPTNYSVTATGATGPASITSVNFEDYTVTSPSGGTLVVTATSGGCNGLSATVTVGSGGGSSSAPAATPQTFELSLTPTDGTTCTNTSQAGFAGTWINLPAANDCTPPASKANAKLLGWATSPDFPVAIAKRQVDNGWGAYETFNADGQLTGVFIPAGGATFLSAAGKLYPIWSE